MRECCSVVLGCRRYYYYIKLRSYIKRLINSVTENPRISAWQKAPHINQTQWKVGRKKWNPLSQNRLPALTNKERIYINKKMTNNSTEKWPNNVSRYFIEKNLLFLFYLKRYWTLLMTRKMWYHFLLTKFHTTKSCNNLLVRIWENSICLLLCILLCILVWTVLY